MFALLLDKFLFLSMLKINKSLFLLKVDKFLLGKNNIFEHISLNISSIKSVILKVNTYLYH
jgi:hypothetical protein